MQNSILNDYEIALSEAIEHYNKLLEASSEAVELRRNCLGESNENIATMVLQLNDMVLNICRIQDNIEQLKMWN